MYSFFIFFSLWAGLYFPQCLILKRKTAQEAHEGLYGQRRILRNVMCTCIAKKWKSISTRGICSAALLRNASDTYPETLLANSSFQVLILSLSVFQTIIHIMCGKASPFRGRKKKKSILNSSFDRFFFSTSLGKYELHPSRTCLLHCFCFVLVGFVFHSKPTSTNSQYFTKSYFRRNLLKQRYSSVH